VSKQEEIREKEVRIRKFLQENELGALLLSKQNNFAWLTAGGDNHVVIASETGVGSILITRDKKKYLIADNIESLRLKEEEELASQGFEVRDYPWYEEERKTDIIRELTSGMKVASDDGFPGTKIVGDKIAELRYSLTEEEMKRYRWVGIKTSEALGQVCGRIRGGDKEEEIAGRLSEELLGQGIVPIVLLVAADERIEKFRHPIPTDKRVNKYAMVVVCGRKWGLIVSLTRFIHFGKIAGALREKHQAVVKVDAAFIANTRPGRAVGDIFAKGVQAYLDNGFSEEWRLHHQGGPTGYAGRDYKAIPEEKRTVQLQQAFAWNPSITGTKSEDTIIALQDKTEIISNTPNWPMLTVEYDGLQWERPDILVI